MTYFILVFFIILFIFEKFGCFRKAERFFEDKFLFNFFSRLGLDYFASFFEEVSSSAPQDYRISILALSSLIIKANGRANKMASNYVRDSYVDSYGKEKANASFRKFKSVTQHHIPTQKLCLEINRVMSYSARLDLIMFFFETANSDGFVTISEEFEIRTIASYMLIQNLDYTRLYESYFEEKEYEGSNYYKDSFSIGSEYQVLGLSDIATAEEVKKAYRTLVKIYHPDRIQNGTVEDISIAKDKFQIIQSAYENIKLQRGF